MTCDRCGMPCQGAMCRDCEMMERLKQRHGVPADHINENEEEDDG